MLISALVRYSFTRKMLVSRDGNAEASTSRSTNLAASHSQDEPILHHQLEHENSISTSIDQSSLRRSHSPYSPPPSLRHNPFSRNSYPKTQPLDRPTPILSLYPIHSPASPPLIRIPAPLHSMVAGAGAGLVASVVTCPLDVLKTALQASSVAAGSAHYEGVQKTATRIWRQAGLRGFYRGLGPTLAGYLPTWGIYFTVYDEIKDRLGAYASDPGELNWWSGFGDCWIGGEMACAWVEADISMGDWLDRTLD